jgi:hypothetical protein
MTKRTKPIAIAARRSRPLDADALREVRGGTPQKIEWTWNDGGITASDDWEART